MEWDDYLPDEEKIEEIFFEDGLDGVKTGNQRYEAVLCLADELRGWQAGYDQERLKKNTSSQTVEQVKALCAAIGKIPLKKKILILKRREKGWKLICEYSLIDYRDGETTFEDVMVQNCLLRHIPGAALAAVEAGGKIKRDYYGFWLEKNTWKVYSPKEQNFPYSFF